jgi:hypothetical protein
MQLAVWMFAVLHKTAGISVQLQLVLHILWLWLVCSCGFVTSSIATWLSRYVHSSSGATLHC